jgi:parallel beta-helix repeat protein
MMLLRMALMLLLISTTAAQAKSYYVEVWGDPHPNCGTKSDPCPSLFWVLNQVPSANSRIIFGPGLYPTDERITIDGLKLESSAGSAATILEAQAAATSVLEVTASKVKIGKRGKGFTIRGIDQTETGIWCSSNCDGLRLEGNILERLSTGASVQGLKGVVRYNRFLSSDDFGLVLVNALRTLVQYNTIYKNQTAGIVMTDTDSINVSKNIISDNGTYGISMVIPSNYNRIQDNQIRRHQLGIGTNDETNGNRIERNIVTTGLTGIATNNYIGLFQVPEQTRHNVVVNQAIYGIKTIKGPGGKFDGNTMVSNGIGHSIGDGLEPAVAFGSYSDNNLFGSTSGCGMELVNPATIDHKKTYFGTHAGLTGPDDFVDGDNHDATCDEFASVVPTGVVSPAKKPNRIKAKAASRL